ncbi:MAG: SDR family NAD(P)-dependent oxidoreductase [Rhodospirillales bacterium]|nr:SDR family NAD(P)-dependent oxidoreductase [Rhodospirillales bacterium]
MSAKTCLVTGGAGFIGSALVRRLVKDGHRVRVFDNASRGSKDRLRDLRADIEFIEADIRDASAVNKAAAGVETVFHLAFVNGTRFFYEMPDLVLDIGVRGMINVVDACRSAGVRELVLASSSEVYQTPPAWPAGEDVPLVVPDPLNPRYSYGGGKIISELMALHQAGKSLARVLIFRPHNVYGPDMGFEHVLPQFVLRMKRLAASSPEGPIQFPLQGDGRQTRAFVFIDDLVEGVTTIMAKGRHLGIYNIGSQEEIAIAEVARMVGAYFGREVALVPGPGAPGSTPRRVPDIGKIAALGYRPKVRLRDGLPLLARWYDANADKAPASAFL